MTVKKFRDIAKDDIRLAGDKVRLQDIIGKVIVVTGYKVTKSKFKENDYATIQFELEGVQHVVFTGAVVLIEQLKKYGENVPFETCIQRMGKFYSFT